MHTGSLGLTTALVGLVLIAVGGKLTQKAAGHITGMVVGPFGCLATLLGFVLAVMGMLGFMQNPW